MGGGGGPGGGGGGHPPAGGLGAAAEAEAMAPWGADHKEIDTITTSSFTDVTPLLPQPFLLVSSN